MSSRVDTLTYEIRWLSPAVRILPGGQHVLLGDFECLIDGTTLTARPRPAFGTADDARVAFEPHLRAWELELELECGHRVDFRLSGSHAVDEPVGGGPTHHVVGMHEYLSISDSVEAIVHSALPTPTGTYRSSPRVEVYVARLRDMRAGRDKAPAAAYALLTDVEHAFGQGNRARAGAVLGVSRGLLDRVALLASGNHPLEGRKVTPAGVALTATDLAWLQRAVALIVRRAAAADAGAASLPPVTVADV